MNPIRVIAYYTFRELLKSRILNNAFFLGCFLIALTYVASEFTYGVPGRIAIDFGLGTLTLSSIGIALFLGVSLLSKEIETKTLFMLLSKPIDRWQILIGKYLGLLSILFLNIAILSLMSLITYSVLGGKLSALIFWNLIYIYLESALVLLIVVLFSLTTNNVVAVISTLVLYVVGHAIDPNIILYFVEGNKFFEIIIKFYHFILPGFYKLNIKDFVLYKQNLKLDYLVGTFSYGVFYSLFLLFLTVKIFKNKDIN